MESRKIVLPVFLLWGWFMQAKATHTSCINGRHRRQKRLVSEPT